MVKIGDMIELENGNKVIVLNISGYYDGRYQITYKHENLGYPIVTPSIGTFLEGDEDFKAL